MNEKTQDSANNTKSRPRVDTNPTQKKIMFEIEC